MGAIVSSPAEELVVLKPDTLPLLWPAGRRLNCEDSQDRRTRRGGKEPGAVQRPFHRGPAGSAFEEGARGFILHALSERPPNTRPVQGAGTRLWDVTAFRGILTNLRFSHVIKEEAPTGPWDKLGC